MLAKRGYREEAHQRDNLYKEDLSTATIELITYTLCVIKIEVKLRYPLYLLGIAKHGVKIKPKILDFY